MPPFHYRYWLYLLSAGTANASISLQILILHNNYAHCNYVCPVVGIVTHHCDLCVCGGE